MFYNNIVKILNKWNFLKTRIWNTLPIDFCISEVILLCKKWNFFKFKKNNTEQNNTFCAS